MECIVNWTGPGGMGFLATTGSGHALVMDGAPHADGTPGGGHNLAPRPMETVLAGAGGCTTSDVILILQRGRQAVTGCSVRLEAERAATDPKVFTRIHLHFTVTGHGLSQAAVERAVRLSQEKYCSAMAMLARTAEISADSEIVEA